MDIEDILRIIATNPDKALDILNLELSMPNVPMPTAGGPTFWSNLAEFNGWKLQQNMVTKHARILNPDDVRVAWGTVNGMYKAMERLADSMNQNQYLRTVSSEDSADAVARLKSLKELLDIGAITQEEFEKKKAEIINLI